MLSGQKQIELRAPDGPRNLALNLHYRGQPLVSVRGPVTGRDYEFSSVQPVQTVDLRDARFLLASPLFKLSR
jgi:hypothetical protein